MRLRPSNRSGWQRLTWAAVLLPVLLAAIGGQSQQPPAPVVTGSRLEDMNWLTAEQRLRPDAVVVLPLGAAAQQHGPHMKLRTDLTLAEYLTRRTLEVSDVVAAPPLPYHYFPAFAEYPGSAGVALDTARDLTADVVRSVARFGPRRFYVINTGYSSNQPLADAAKLLASEGVLLRYTDMRSKLDAARVPLRQPGGNHADEVETSMMLYIDPSTVDMTAAVRDYTPSTATPFQLTRRPGGRGLYSATGVWGDATAATREKGRLLVETLVTGIRSDIEDLRRASPPPAGSTPATDGGRRGMPPSMGPASRTPGECLQGDDRAIRALGSAFALAWLNQDAMRISQFWAGGGDMAHPDGLVEGTQQIIRQNRAYLFQQPEYRGSRHSLTIGTIRCITPDIAIADAKWDLRGVTDPKGQPAPPAEGLCTLVLKRAGGSWEIEAWRYNMKPSSVATPPTLLRRPGLPDPIR